MNKKKKQLEEEYKQLNAENKIISYLSLKNMKKEIYSYGYTYSNKSFFLMIFACLGISVIFAFLYHLKPLYTLAVFITCLLCLPALITSRFKGTFQEQRFNEVDIYLHQMSISFQKNPKILDALEDTMKVSTGALRKTIIKAIEEIRNSSSSNVYEDALKIIEKKYNNSRVIALHKFMIKIEKNGGRYTTALNLMLADVDSWVNRTYIAQKDVKNIKKNTIIGLGIAYFMGCVTIIISEFSSKTGQGIMSNSVNIYDDVIYQVSSMIFLIASVLYFTYTQVKYNYDWVTKTRDNKIIERDYKNATEFDAKAFRKKIFPFYLIVLIIAVAFFFMKFMPFNIYIAGGIVLLDVYFVVQPSFTRKTAMKRTQKNIQEAFGEWLRDVSLNLQDEPLLSAIEDTYETCPTAIKPELTIFLTRITKEPTAVEPYYEFLSRFNMLDINSAVRNLYSLSDNNSEDMDKQLNELVKRNYKIIDKSESDGMEDINSLMRFSEYIPAVLGSLKMAMDMISLITTML